MTTYVSFAPSNNAAPPFQFQAVLDGQIYTVATVWNFAAQRWYLSITDLSGTLIVFRPLVGSPPTNTLTALSWAIGIATAVSPVVLGYHIGSLVNITIAGALPAALSGIFPCTVIGPSTFTYPVAADPGPVTSAGAFSTDINLVAGYFSTSTLVFRANSQNFEISP